MKKYFCGWYYRCQTDTQTLAIIPSIIRQGKCTLTAKRLYTPGYPLQAPVCGSMSRTLYAHPSCRANYRFVENGHTLLELILFSN